MQTVMQILEEKKSTRSLQGHKHASAFFNIAEEQLKSQWNFALIGGSQVSFQVWSAKDRWEPPHLAKQFYRLSINTQLFPVLPQSNVTGFQENKNTKY